MSFFELNKDQAILKKQYLIKLALRGMFMANYLIVIIKKR